MVESPQSLVRELSPKLPRTFVPSLNDQLRQWDMLFPAEQRTITAQLEYLGRLPESSFHDLFAPVVALESRMNLAGFDAASVRATGILARSPLYPKWRAEVESIFAKVDTAVGVLEPHPRVVLCVLPPGLPVADRPLWPDLGSKGFWIPLSAPFGDHWTALATAIATRSAPAGLEPIERTWILECDTRLSPLAESSTAVVLSWTALESARREFLNRLNRVRRDLGSVDQTHDELKRLSLARLLPARLESEPRLREFVRGLLLSGNGSLVFNNSFVQWGASEAMRRAQPQAVIAAFGVRPKLKPFSSTVLFEDQHRNNPAPDANDPEGSLVDALELSNYVHYAAQRVAAYQGRTMTLLAACGLDRVLAVGGPQPPSASRRMSAEDLSSFVLNWLSS